MAIQIERNENGNCIVFKGSTQPVYWNNCLSAVGIGTDRISIKNDIRSAGAGRTYYEYFNVKVSDFVDSSGNAFASQAAAITYINNAAQATPSGGGGGGGISSSFADNSKLTFGTGNDLEIFHDGNDSNIADVGTGNLHITSSDFTTFYNPGKTIKRAVFGDYNCSFFYGNVEKLKIVGYGATVSGSIFATGIITATSFHGDGSNLTGINAGVGTEGSVNTTGIITATEFHGSGAGIAYTTISGIPVAPLTVNEFEYYQQYASPVGNGSATPGPEISTVTPAYSNNPFYYGTQLKPGQEMRWTHHSDSDNERYGLGMWGGSTTFTPTNAFHTSLWSRIARFDYLMVDFGGSSFDSKGFVPSAGAASTSYTISTSTELSLAYNEYTNKLEVHDVTGGNRHIVATASTAEDGNPVSISFAISNNGALPGITTVTDYEYPSTWLVGYGVTSNQALATPFSNSSNRDKHPVYWPQQLEPGYEYRFTSLNTSVVDHFYILGIWGGPTDTAYGPRSYNHLNWDMCYSIGTDTTQNILAPSGADNYFSSGDDNGSKNTTVATATSTFFPKGEILTLNYSPTDGKIRLINETQGYVAFGTSNNAFSGVQKIHMGGKNALVAAPTLQKRDQSWEKIAYRYTSGSTWRWREDGGDQSYVNMQATRDLLPGQRVEFRIPQQGVNHYYWIAANGWQGPTGQTDDLSSTSNIAAGADIYWRWDTGEDTSTDDGWTYNTSNSKYDSSNGDWNGGNSHEHRIQYRYRTSDNKVEWWDVTPDNSSAPERIATSTTNLGGAPIRMGIASIQNDIRTSGTNKDLHELIYSNN